jgi:hypothetical protein
MTFKNLCRNLSKYKDSNARFSKFISVLVFVPRILVYIFIENQQMHPNDHFIVMLSQTLLHVSAYQRHHQGAHMILPSYVYVGVQYKRNNGLSSEVDPISIDTLWIKVVVVNRCWKQWTILIGAISLHNPLFLL